MMNYIGLYLYLYFERSNTEVYSKTFLCDITLYNNVLEANIKSFVMTSAGACCTRWLAGRPAVTLLSRVLAGIKVMKVKQLGELFTELQTTHAVTHPVQGRWPQTETQSVWNNEE